MSARPLRSEGVGRKKDRGVAELVGAVEHGWRAGGRWKNRGGVDRGRAGGA